MQKLIFIILMSVLSSSAFAGSSTIASFDVRGWHIEALKADDTGEFYSCIASSDYRSGMTLAFMISDEFAWSLALLDVPFPLKKDQKLDVAFQIDGGRVHQGVGSTSKSKDFVFIPLADNRSLFEEFRQGRLLRIKVAGRISGFELDGTAAMLAALLDCAGRYRNSPKAAPPPQVSAKQDKPAGQPAPSAKGTSAGSGFFVTADGVALTNAHVLEGCTDAVIASYGAARIVVRDEVNDLALLKLISPAATTPARFRRKPIMLGETAFAMGFPLAGQLDNGLNFTSGIISSLAGPGNDTRALQLTAPIQAGNSGGPIVDNAGLVVGVTQAKLSEVAAIRAGGAFPQNVNFGIKADLATNFLRANAIDPQDSESGEQQPTVNVARDGRAYTVQVKCNPR